MYVLCTKWQELVGKEKWGVKKTVWEWLKEDVIPGTCEEEIKIVWEKDKRQGDIFNLSYVIHSPLGNLLDKGTSQFYLIIFYTITWY